MDNIGKFNEGQQGRSCLSQLLAHYEEILIDIPDGDNVNAIYLESRLGQSLW